MKHKIPKGSSLLEQRLDLLVVERGRQLSGIEMDLLYQTFPLSEGKVLYGCKAHVPVLIVDFTELISHYQEYHPEVLKDLVIDL